MSERESHSVLGSDFRSDTVTKPTGAMLRAMASAELGDDVFGDDPTVNRLEELAAATLGKEAALFVPSGVMGNLTAILVHTVRGDEVILEENSHTFHFETGGAAAIAGVQTRTVPSDAGIPGIVAIEEAIRPENIHFPRTSLLVYENTNNISGGAIVPVEVMREVHALAHERDVAVHLDGARLWHAHVATRTPLPEFTQYADTVMCCLSKGLSAPVGSLLCGSKEFIRAARRSRKQLGGGMRQAGVLAAAGIVAITEMIERLEEDHKRAKTLAQGFATIRGVQIDPDKVQTNIVIFRVVGPSPKYEEIIRFLADQRVLAVSLWGRGIRFVTHRMIGDADIERAIAAMNAASSAGLFRR
jgi:threonine aldolase